MKTSESIASFQQQQGHPPVGLMEQQEAIRSGSFHAYTIEGYCNAPMLYSRRNFYKISLLTAGHTQLNYAERGIVINQPALIFSNPLVPYSCDILSELPQGYFCMFTEDFLIINDRSAGLQDSPLFKLGNDPVFFLNELQVATLQHLFQQLLTEQASAYLYKQDLLRTYVNLIIHEALKLQPHTTYYRHQNASSRILALFTELLERQFPVESANQPIRLRTASDFATHLSVHVNHLNRAVRELTGKTTTSHITERILTEAKALLLHTNWSTAEIAYSLGFEYPTYFNNFFKKRTGVAPASLRACPEALTK